VGTIWAHEIDIFRTWKLIGNAQFHQVQEVHFRKLAYWIFAPVGLALLGNLALIWYRPNDFAGLVRLGGTCTSVAVCWVDRCVLGKVAGETGER
jgi:hypothetical protein